MKQDWYPDELTQHWRFPLRSANYSTVRLAQPESASPYESGRFRGVIRFKTVGLRLDKLFACLNLRYRPLRFINFA
jgi:hypothetical protein